jgi:hypothetical protein
MKRVVINTMYGGFGLSEKAMLLLEEKGVIELTRTDSKFCPLRINEPDEDSIRFRSHPELIRVVEEMGEESFGPFAELEIVKIPDNIEFYIDSNDGMEWLSRKRSQGDWYA